MYERHLPPLVLLLGVLLLANPLYAFPAGASPTHHYAVDQIETDDDTAVTQSMRQTGETFSCPSGPRACALELAVAENGSVTVEDDVSLRQTGYRSTYDVFWIDGGYVEPVTDVDGDTATLTHDPITQSEALERIALDSDDVSADARRAVEAGSIWTDGPVPELSSRAIIAYEGEYYQVVRSQFSRDGIVRSWVWLVRGIGFVLGGILFAVGYRTSMG